MLFYISPNLVSKLKDKPTSNIIEAIDNLAFSRKQGYHLLTADYNDLNILKECKELQQNTRFIFNQLSLVWSHSTGQLKELFKYYVEVVSEPEIIQIKDNEVNNEIIELSIDYLQDFKILNETRILAENQKEINYYLFIAKFFKKRNRLLSIPEKYYPLMGGGDTTASVYESEQNNKKSFCLCFADKDIKYPNCAVGRTLKNIVSIDNENIPISKLIAIDVREIENLIPLKQLTIASENNPNYKKGIEFIQEMINKGLKDEIKYLDLKKGLSLKKFVEIKAQNQLEFLKLILKTTPFSEFDFENCRNFIDNVKQTSENNQRISFSEFIQLKEKYIETNEVEQKVLDFFDNTNIIHGLGNDLLNRIIDYHIDNETITKNDLLDFQMKEWDKIGEYISSWTCGASSIFITKK